MNLSLLAQVLFVGVVSEALTEAFVDAEPMEPVRHWLGTLHQLVAILVNCGKCSSFWIALAVSIPVAGSWGWWPWLVTWLAGWRVGGLWHDLLTWVGYQKETLRGELPVD